jgi:predicted enzyme related to lactoylglutathione lyase
VTLSLVVLKTRQVDALRKFYDALGIELTEEQHGKGPVHFAGQVGHVVLEIYPLAQDATSVDATTRLGFVVANVAEVVRALQALGAAVVSEPQATKWGIRAVVRDPDGRAVELCER